MKLVKFLSEEGNPIYVNPTYVTYCRDAGMCVVIAQSADNYVYVKGTLEAVVKALEEQ